MSAALLAITKELVGLSGYSLITPLVVIRPILGELPFVYHSAPSGPAVMPTAPAVDSGYSGSAPAVVILPTVFVPCSVNHSAPSGRRLSYRRAARGCECVFGKDAGGGDPADLVALGLDEP